VYTVAIKAIIIQISSMANNILNAEFSSDKSVVVVGSIFFACYADTTQIKWTKTPLLSLKGLKTIN
jgi:hypothetical protein